MKPVYHYDIEQNTPEWLQIRSGRFTASEFPKLFMNESKIGYQNLINRVVFERLTGEAPEGFTNEWMERGHELEPEALERYKFETFNITERVGFVELGEWIGCSPDALVGEDGLVQIKSPKYSTLIDYLLKDKVPNDYMIQCQGELMVTQRQWNDFFAYHPHLKPMIKRIYRDEKMIAEIKANLDKAIQEAQKRIKKLESLKG